MIHLEVLGGLALDAPELAENASARRRRLMALLAVLAAHAPHPVGRDKLVALLWPESDGERARNSLRQTLFWLRRDLGEDLFLPETASGLQLNPSRISVDLWELREDLNSGRLEEAVERYRGPFLDGFHVPGIPEFSHWVDVERERVARRHLEALDALARAAQAAGHPAEAVAWRRRQAAVDPYSSRVALALLEALVAAGDRTGALEFAGVYENLVRLHLEAAPDPRVSALVDELRRAPATSPGLRDPALPASSLRVIGADADAGGGTLPPTGVTAPPVREGPGAGRLLWVVGAAALLVVLVNLAPPRRSEAPPVLVLGSGVSVVEGRDTATHLLSCEGPACPPGPFPQASFVVPAHPYYAPPSAGTRFVAPIPDGTVREPPGLRCCSVAVFERVFVLPAGVASGVITMSVLADNQARVAVNGVEVFRQADSLNAGNYGGPRRSFTASFPVATEGPNRIRITLWNGGGAVGLHYHAVVTWDEVAEVAEDSVLPPVGSVVASPIRRGVHGHNESYTRS